MRGEWGLASFLVSSFLLHSCTSFFFFFFTVSHRTVFWDFGNWYTYRAFGILGIRYEHGHGKLGIGMLASGRDGMGWDLHSRLHELMLLLLLERFFLVSVSLRDDNTTSNLRYGKNCIGRTCRTAGTEYGPLRYEYDEFGYELGDRQAVEHDWNFRAVRPALGGKQGTGEGRDGTSKTGLESQQGHWERNGRPSTVPIRKAKWSTRRTKKEVTKEYGHEIMTNTRCFCCVYLKAYCATHATFVTLSRCKLPASFCIPDAGRRSGPTLTGKQVQCIQ